MFQCSFSLNLNTSFIDETEFNLEGSRQNIVNTFCNEDKAENWQDILDGAGASQEFVVDLYKYAKNNLLKVHLFISSPFATEFNRSVETTLASFIANIGGSFRSVTFLNR